ncbi:hypothetical protein IPZ58_11965 [Streptomyces roseoverticillatus]|uniref:hypothetical protein n=1 Tax=Streptomyces roseoverticillatus TaxID=66429 RepID=UPI001F3AE2FB|nr:hypothetical protein [Streptomyces roseoverticillatus]MCF3102299.1 hypothetical protein [Streptomyces roseoverticillatus]
MGADITALIVDWAELENIPVLERERALFEAADPDDYDGALDEGWAWLPPAPASFPSWCARYEFGGTLGSFKPHFWACERWETIREHVPDDLRTALDTFLAGLFWAPPWTDSDPQDEDDTEPSYGAMRTFCPPPDVSVLAQAWSAVGPRLEGLREPFDVHAAAPGEWIGRFEEFSRLLHGWAEAVEEARRRGWGLIGLPI